MSSFGASNSKRRRQKEQHILTHHGATSLRPIDLVFVRLRQRNCRPRRVGKGWLALCPVPTHGGDGDQQPSLFVSEADDGRVLLYCHGGCQTEEILEALDLTWSDLFPVPSNGRGGDVQWTCEDRIMRTYDYRDENGNLLFQVVRTAPKKFRQRRPDGKGGWIWDLKGVRRVPYRLPDLLETGSEHPDAPVFIVEGEKDVDNLWQKGLLATCNPGGAGKWRKEYTKALLNVLQDRAVFVLPDNDKAGRRHAEDVARSILHLIPEAQVKIIELPGLPDKGDVSDWFDAGHTVDELLQTAEQAPPYRPADPANTARTTGSASYGSQDHCPGERNDALNIRFEFQGYRRGVACTIRAILIRADGEQPIETDHFNPYNRSRRATFCRRVAETSTQHGHEVRPDQVEHRLLQALDDLTRQTESKSFERHPSLILPDGRIAEQVYDAESHRAAFVVCGPEESIRIMECIQVGERIIEPVGGAKGDAFLQAGTIRLPSFRVAEIQPPHTAEILAEVERFISKYVGLHRDDLTAVACYGLLTWVSDKADAIPYLCFRGDYGVGKSRALQVVGSICRRPAMISASPTPAVLFRLIDQWRPTVLIDEFNRDWGAADDIVAILNAGYQRGATVLRCVGDENEPRPFRCYGPKIIATRQPLKDDALESRLLVIRMPGDKPDDIPVVLDRETFEREAQRLRDLLCAWRLRCWHELDLTNPGIDLPDLDNRYKQIIAPLLAIAPPTKLAQLRDWFVQHVARQVEEQSDRWTARIARIVVEHFRNHEGEPLLIADIRSALEAETEDGERLDVPSNAKIGRITKNLGLPKARDPITRRMVIPASQETLKVIKRLKRRYIPPRVDTAENFSILSNLSELNRNSVRTEDLCSQMETALTPAIPSERVSNLSEDRKDELESASDRNSLKNLSLRGKSERTERFERTCEQDLASTSRNARASSDNAANEIRNGASANGQAADTPSRKTGSSANDLKRRSWATLKSQLDALTDWNKTMQRLENERAQQCRRDAEERNSNLTAGDQHAGKQVKVNGG